MPLTTSLRPLLLTVALPALALLAFRGAPRKLGDVSAHPRFRTVEEDTGLKAFIGVRMSAPSTDALLAAVQDLVPLVKAAKRDAADALLSGEWEVVHEVELVIGEEVTRMNAAEFAQFINDARYLRLRARKPITAPSRR